MWGYVKGIFVVETRKKGSQERGKRLMYRGSAADVCFDLTYWALLFWLIRDTPYIFALLLLFSPNQLVDLKKLRHQIHRNTFS